MHSIDPELQAIDRLASSDFAYLETLVEKAKLLGSPPPMRESIDRLQAILDLPHVQERMARYYAWSKTRSGRLALWAYDHHGLWLYRKLAKRAGF